MSDEVDDVLESLHAAGYDSITRTEGYNEASGTVTLPQEHRQEPPTGWRRLLPRLYSGGDPDLIPTDLRTTVEDHGWTVQPMGRDATTVTVVISENGV